MGKELENIILENTELLETKYVLCYRKNVEYCGFIIICWFPVYR